MWSKLINRHARFLSVWTHCFLRFLMATASQMPSHDWRVQPCNLHPSLENCCLCPNSLMLDSHKNFRISLPYYVQELLRLFRGLLGVDMLEQTQASPTPGKHPALGFTHSPVLTFSLELKQIALGEEDIFGRYYLLYYYDVQRLSCCLALG